MTENEQTAIQPKRGAPLGNTNALKHGFYSKQLRAMRADGPLPEEITDRIGLSDEIAMLRLFTRRLIRMGSDIEDLETAISLLRVLCLASTTLTRLLRTQALFAQENELADAISQALDELAPVLFPPEQLESSKPAWRI